MATVVVKIDRDEILKLITKNWPDKRAVFMALGTRTWELMDKPRRRSAEWIWPAILLKHFGWGLQNSARTPEDCVVHFREVIEYLEKPRYVSSE
ncbi:MAG: hypothetical protein PHV93_04215 [Candidatus Pacebacteria bacterium]|nr:hypothetical protein [Candidatus Paceibacterota bacterium]